MTSQIKTIHLEDVIKNHTQDMTNKVVVITGTTSGTGFVCAREVAKKGATVILLNRESERSEKAYNQLLESVPDGKFDPIACDLQSFESVRSSMKVIKTKYDVIDVLVNNAGVMALRDQTTTDGYDIQMQTNSISHFLITKELFPLLKNSSQARIINHTSMARLGSPLNMDYFLKKGGNLGGDGTDEENQAFQGPRWQRYHQSKLANCAFTYGLQKKLKEANISKIIPLLAHPGLALTNLQVTTAATGGMDNNSDFMSQAQSAEDGATGIIRGAMAKDVKPGDFYGPEGYKGFPELLIPEDFLFSDETIQINWEGCEQAVGEFRF